MITPDQQKWLDHLNSEGIVHIFPYDDQAPQKFEEVKSRVQKVIGTEYQILHRGASALQISGQREIDVYIPVDQILMEKLAKQMEEVFGKPKSIYPLERIKWLLKVGDTNVEVMIVNKDSESWINNERFFNHLKMNPKDLERYRILKEEGNDKQTKEYYRKKIEFINEILGI
jgi:GrpB-like predicted nucleotidyltransferase (UPF0157 family)